MLFDISSWRKIVGELKSNEFGYWDQLSVLGPYDACYALNIRNLVRDQFRLGEEVASDIFILAFGESEVRDGCKIGGIPFRSSRKSWPRSRHGDLLPFLAQFDFRDSVDIVGTLPGDILLIFAHPDLHDGLVMEWTLASQTQDLIAKQELPIDAGIQAYHGMRWRTTGFPNWSPLNGDYSSIVLPDNTIAADYPFALNILGMQIGPHPYLPSWSRVASENERIICSLCSVFPRAGRPHPFLNREKPLTDEEAKACQIKISEIRDCDGFGILYFIETAEKDFRWELVQL